MKTFFIPGGIVPWIGKTSNGLKPELLFGPF